MPAIFISYRRDDSEGHAGRLFEDLSDRFGKASVFMDVAGIEPGRDFRRVIEQQVASCGVLLTIIGKDWLTAADELGRRRLDDPYDFVHLETASALQRDIPVIPVLVHGARMPRPEQLPDVLKDLAFRNSVELTHARWRSDVRLLIDALTPYAGATADATPQAAAGAKETLPVATLNQSDGQNSRDTYAAALRPPETVGRAEPGRSLPMLLTAALAIALAGVGYFVWDRAGTPKPSEAVAKAIATEKPGGESILPGKAASASTLSTSAQIATDTAKGTPMPAKPVVAQPVDPTRTEKAAADRAHIDRVVRATVPTKPTATVKTEAGIAVDRLVANRSIAERSVFGRPAVDGSAIDTATTASARDSLTAKPAATVKTEAVAAFDRPVANGPMAERSAPDRPAADRPVTDIATVAGAKDPLIDLLGSPASPASAKRTIAINPGTKYVNVTGGEIVQFTVDGKAFAWNFNGRSNSFDLTRIAPAGMLDHKITAYVAPNPLFGRVRH